MIIVNDIHKSFGDNEVLKGISARFEPGMTSLVIGASGSGKSVFMKSLVGLLKVDKGEIIIDEINFTKAPAEEKKTVRRKVGMLFQGGALFDSMTVEQNVMFPLNMFTKMTKKEQLDRVNFCLERVNLENSNKLFPAELSGGMQKRVGIARAIVQNPKYLLCDEPNSGLDPQTSILIDQLIHEITVENNITTVINTHDMNSVMGIGEHVIFLYEGNKHWEGSKEDILTSKNEELQDFIFASDFLKEMRKTQLKKINS